MTLDEARKQLSTGGALVDLMEAIGVIAHDPRSSVDDLLLGLEQPECVAEQAALALHRRTERPISQDRPLSADAKEWARWLSRPISRQDDSSLEPERKLARTLGVDRDSLARAARVAVTERYMIREFLTRDLAAKDRLIIILYYYERESFRTIASMLDVTESQVRQRHEQIIELLRNRFTEDVGGQVA